jgi:chitinase
MPLYGRSFLNTSGPTHPFNGVGPGSWEAGSYDYKALPLPGSTESFDPNLTASWSYDGTKREFVTYDTPEAAAAKAEVRSLPVSALSPFSSLFVSRS